MSARFASAVVLHAGWDLGEIGTLAHPSPRTPKDTKGARGPSLTHLPSRRIPRHGARLAHSRPCAYPPPRTEVHPWPTTPGSPVSVSQVDKSNNGTSKFRKEVRLSHTLTLSLFLSLCLASPPPSPSLHFSLPTACPSSVRRSASPFFPLSLPPSLHPSLHSLSPSLARALALSLPPSHSRDSLTLSLPSQPPLHWTHCRDS
jgi:hypothetical protein